MSILCSRCKRSITVRGYITCRDGLLYTGGRPAWVDTYVDRREIQCDGFVPKDEGDVQ